MASFDAVPKEMLTSWLSTLWIYGPDTFIRRASSFCVTSSSDMRSTMLLMKEDESVLIMRDGVEGWKFRSLEVWKFALEV